MGEYVKLDGQSVKLGTCENLYYCTFDALCAHVDRMEQQSGNLAPRDYLKARYGFRYRFPFPDEDSLYIGTHHNHDRGYLVILPDDNALNIGNDAVHHDEVRVEIPYAGETRLITLPCPYSPAFKSLGLKISISSGEENCEAIEIIQQKQCEGDLWTVIRCVSCHAAYRLPPSDGLWLANHLHRTKDEFAQEIGRRIARGYGQVIVEENAA
jgi:hypothetical protein